MEKLIGVLKRRRSLILASAFAPMCFGALLGGGGLLQEQRIRRPRPQLPTRTDIKIVNKTTTLEVTLETQADNLLLVRLKNVSSKDLNGFEVELTNKVRITTDISSGDRVIPPGETHDMNIPLDSSPQEITILAAMFADGSIEGEPATVEELRRWRLGLKEELTRNLPVLDAMLKSPDISMALDSLRIRPDISEVVKAGVPSGAQAARESIDTEIRLLQQRLQHGETLTQKEGLLELRRRLERRIASL